MRWSKTGLGLIAVPSGGACAKMRCAKVTVDVGCALSLFLLACLLACLLQEEGQIELLCYVAAVSGIETPSKQESRVVP